MMMKYLYLARKKLPAFLAGKKGSMDGHDHKLMILLNNR
jgi:hypothetical protein